jgi:MFS family permease
MSLLWILAIVLAALLFAAVLVGLLALLLSGVRRRLTASLGARLAARYRPEEVLRQELLANFFGQESLGAAQMRGNGALVLTRAGLHFFMAVPERELEIPASAIAGTEIVRWHLGKSVGRELVKVRFRTPAGEDSAAWWVSDPRGWQGELEDLGR